MSLVSWICWSVHGGFFLVIDLDTCIDFWCCHWTHPPHVLLCAGLGTLFGMDPSAKQIVHGIVAAQSGWCALSSAAGPNREHHGRGGPCGTVYNSRLVTDQLIPA